MASPAAPSWATLPAHATWRGHDGAMPAGTYEVRIDQRVTNATDDVIIPAGVYAKGPLNTTPGLPSLQVDLPCNDDPDNSPNGFKVTVSITFATATGMAAETYRLDTPIALAEVGINLRAIPFPTNQPAPGSVVLVRGVPGGIAELDADGDVIDAEGNKVTGGGGGGVEGAVTSINGIEPFEGEVTLEADDVGALPDDAPVVLDDDPRLADARTPTAHEHEITDVDGLQAVLNDKVDLEAIGVQIAGILDHDVPGVVNN